MNSLKINLSFLFLFFLGFVSQEPIFIIYEFSYKLYFCFKISSDDDEEQCLKLFKSQTRPRNCCNYPLRFIHPVHQEKCKKSCENISDNTGGCCILDCIYHVTGVVRDFKLDPLAFLELYENYLSEKGGGKFDQWMLVVENSIEACLNLGKKSFVKVCVKKIITSFIFLVPNEGSIFTCSIPQFALDVMDCVSHFNFYNCPNFKNSSECENLKKFVGKLDQCGKKLNGTFIIDSRFFDLDKYNIQSSKKRDF